MPCLNEARTLPACIRAAQAYLERSGVHGEVLVADNGSDDGSPDVAEALGARVIRVEEKGYGAALSAGIGSARGRYVVMGDADASYDFSNLDGFMAKLREGYALVMGNRFEGGIAPGAMPFLNRYLGNPVLTALGRLFYRSPIGDFHCGLRGFDRAAIERLELTTSGMEFASEMVVKATLQGLRIAEVPTTLFPDGRDRPPHLRPWRDGWRHLRFLLIYSPRWLFFYPGILLTAAGLSLFAWLLPGVRNIGAVALDIHTLVYAGGLVIVGLQATLFAIFTKVLGMNLKLLPPDPLFSRIVGSFTLERGLALGALLVAAGLAGSVYAVALWQGSSFGPQEPRALMRVVVPSLTAIVSGMEIVFASFFMSVIELNRRK
jgi:glycosyltransferase involved in cell wall biosynthesis